MRKKDEKITWSVPAWHHIPKAREELKRVFTPGFFFRISTGSAGVMFLFVFWAKKTLPELADLEWLKLAIYSFSCGLLMLTLVMVSTFISPTMICRKRGIMISTGQSTRLLTYDQIRSMRVVMVTNERAVLEIATNHKEKSYGISPKVEIGQLVSGLEKWSGQRISIEKGP